MTLEELHEMVNLPLVWEDSDPAYFMVGKLTEEITFKVIQKNFKMYHVILPDDPKMILKCPDEDVAKRVALEYALENWHQIIDARITFQSGQTDLFNTHEFDIAQLQELHSLSTEHIRQAYILKINGEV